MASGKTWQRMGGGWENMEQHVRLRCGVAHTRGAATTHKQPPRDHTQKANRTRKQSTSGTRVWAGCAHSLDRQATTGSMFARCEYASHFASVG